MVVKKGTLGSEITRSRPFPTPRDPEIAVREELELAITSGKIDAIELFLARHAAHPLAEDARRAIDQLRKKGATK